MGRGRVTYSVLRGAWLPIASRHFPTFAKYLLGSGEFDPEAAAVAGNGFEADGPPHAFDTFANNGKADAGAGVAGAVQAFEDAKDPAALFGRNT